MIYLQRFDANQQGRDFVCGDLHGQVEQLFEAMQSVAFEPDRDRVFSVGDLVDRGEQSQRAFELLREPWFFAVRGNHEALMFSAFEGGDPRAQALWMANGGKNWVEDPAGFFQQNPAFSELVAQQREQLPWSLEVSLVDGRRVGLIHAECPCSDWRQLERVLADTGLSGQAARYDALWSRSARDPHAGQAIEHIDLTVHGHCIVPRPGRRHNCCYIDTGACLSSSSLFGLVKKRQGYLSLLRLEQLFDLSPLY